MTRASRVVQTIICLAVLVVPAQCPALGAETVAATLLRLGLIGTWSRDCAKAPTIHEPGFRVIFANSDAGATYTTVDSSGGIITTVRSRLLVVLPLGGNRVRLRLRILGGDRDGGPLPSPTTNTFEQTFERITDDQIRLDGSAPELLKRCR